MATPNVKRVTIDLDRPRVLLLNLNAYCLAEEITGRNYMKSIEDLSFKDIRALLFAGLKHEDPNLTIENVGEMIDVNNLSVVSDALSAAFVTSMPAPEDATKSQVPLESAGVGRQTVLT